MTNMSIRMLRAVMIGAAVAMVADGWRSLIATVLLILAFIGTDYIAEGQIKDAADRLRVRIGRLR